MEPPGVAAGLPLLASRPGRESAQADHCAQAPIRSSKVALSTREGECVINALPVNVQTGQQRARLTQASRLW